MHASSSLCTYDKYMYSELFIPWIIDIIPYGLEMDVYHSILGCAMHALVSKW